MLRVLNRSIMIAVFVAAITSISAFGQSTGGVKGKLRNADGKPIADATVSARQNNEDVRSTKTDSKGNFELTGLQPGKYNIAFDARGYSTGVKFNVDIRAGSPVDLGGNLILAVDRGSLVIIQGSVFYKDGRSLSGARIEIHKLEANGSAKKVSTLYTNVSGEFTLRQPEGQARYRITAKYRDKTASKEIDVDSAAIYRLAISLDMTRGEDQ